MAAAGVVFRRVRGRIVPIRGSASTSPRKAVVTPQQTTPEQRYDRAAKTLYFGSGAGLSGGGMYVAHKFTQALNNPALRTKLVPQIARGIRRTALGAGIALGAASAFGTARKKDAEIHLRKKNASGGQILLHNTKAKLGDVASFGAGIAAPIAAIKGTKHLLFGIRDAKNAAPGFASRVSKAWHASRRGRTTVMKTRFSGPAKTVYDSTKRIGGAVGY